MQQAHALGLTLLLAQQSHDISQGRKPTTSIDLATLSRRQRVELKKTLAELQNIPMLLRSIMFETSPSRSSPATNHHD